MPGQWCCTACALHAPAGLLGNLPKITCHLSASTAKQQSPQDDIKSAFKLVLQCTYEQTTQSCKVQLLSKVEQNTHMAMQLCCRACPHIADNPPLPQVCKEVLHPCAIEAMDIYLLVGLHLKFSAQYKIPQCASSPCRRHHVHLLQNRRTAHVFAKDHVDPKS